MKIAPTTLPMLGLFSAIAMADFFIGKYSGEQLGGTWGQPGSLGMTGTWISTNIPGQDDGFTKDEFCDAGLSADASVDKWHDWTNNNFCDLEIPGCPKSLRIVKSAGSFSGDCGAEQANTDYTGDYGVLIDTVTSPDAAVGNCYYTHGKQSTDCHNTGTITYNGYIVCVTSVCGGAFDGDLDI